MGEAKGIIEFQLEDEIGILTIANGKQNKINKTEFLDVSYLNEWIRLNKVKGIVIQGAGRHFSAGADLEIIYDSDEETLYNTLQTGKKILDEIENLPVITVAAISGICFGGGLEIALSCQYRIATQGAVIGFPEAMHGLMPGMGGTFRLPQLVGKSKAIELMVSAKAINAEEAKAIGLVDEIVENKRHLQRAKEYIQTLSQDRSYEQLESIVKCVNCGFYSGKQETLGLESELFLNLVNKTK